MPLIKPSPHLLYLLAPSVSVSTRVHQIVRSVGLQKNKMHLNVIAIHNTTMFSMKNLRRWINCRHVQYARWGQKMLDKHQDFAVTYRVDKEGFEVLGFRTQLLRPGDLSFQDLVDRIHVVQVWPFREKQLSPSSEQSLQRNATQLRTQLHQQRELFSQKEFPQQEFLFTSCVASVTSEGLNLCRVKLSNSLKSILVNGFQMQKKSH